MISSFGYRMLRELKGFGEIISVFTMSKIMEVAPSVIRNVFRTLQNQGLIRQTALGYQITEEGLAELDNAVDRPGMCDDAKKWASLVRQGIDSSGRETKIEKAAIPNRFAAEISYTPDMEGLIDALREGLSEYD